MGEGGSIISLADRRSGRRQQHRAPIVSKPTRPTRLIVAAVLCVGLLPFVAALFLVSKRDHGVVGAQPDRTQQELYLRALDELRGLCLRSEAALGPVRDHCVAQARFVLLLPACGDECRRVATPVLPQAHE
jgi:hypothetical protein